VAVALLLAGGEAVGRDDDLGRRPGRVGVDVRRAPVTKVPRTFVTMACRAVKPMRVCAGSIW
jgi:hypothetical protein